MKPVLARWVVALLLGLAVSPVAARVVLDLSDGYGRLSFVDGNSHSILCEKISSGQNQRELLCFDARNGSLRWREAMSNGVDASCCAVGENSFFLVSGGILSKRKLDNGQIIWSTKIAAIPAHTSRPLPTPREHFERLMESVKARFRTPSVALVPKTNLMPTNASPGNFRYAGPFQADGRVFINRQAGILGGCLISIYFEDWLTFDESDGLCLGGGDGELVGRAGNAFVVTGPNPRIIARDVARRTPAVDKLGPTQSILLGSPHAGHESLSDGLLLIHTTLESAGVTYEQIRVLDADGSAVSDFKLPLNDGYAADWVISGKHLVRYVLGPLNEADSPTGTFELYDLAGKYKRRLGLAGLGTNGAPECTFLGRTAGNDIVFEAEHEIILLEVPSLAVKHRQQIVKADVPTDGVSRESDFHAIPGTDYICQMNYSYTLAKMSTPEVALPVGVRVMHAYTGKTLWEYTETITIRKRKLEQVTAK